MYPSVVYLPPPPATLAAEALAREKRLRAHGLAYIQSGDQMLTRAMQQPAETRSRLELFLGRMTLELGKSLCAAGLPASTRCGMLPPFPA